MAQVKMETGRTWLNELKPPSRLGHKNEAYFKTEQEALKQKNYTYESLSISEKIIYDKLEENGQKLHG
jgi:hypothetical protein